MNQINLFLKKSVNLKRIVNAAKNQMSLLLSNVFHRAVVWGNAPVIMIEPTNICNLRCPLCPSGNGTLKRAKGYMDLDLYKKIIDDVKDYAVEAVLWNQGEPFLHKDILEMIKYASDAGLFVLLSTNVNVMPDPEKLVRSGLDSLIVSLDGAEQETYNKYRINGNLQKVKENVQNLVSAKKKLNSVTPYLRWQFIVMKHNEHEIEEIKAMAKKSGVDKLELKTAQIYSKEDVFNYLPENPKYRRYKITGNNFELKFGIQNKCRRIWTTAVINWDGEMSVCCFDKDVDFKIGNVKEKSVGELFKSEKFNKIRNIILKNRKSLEICRNCGEGVKLRVKNNPD
ncbi:MAG: aldehyde ferredoxin oxidoreductase [Candidatus Cloacimonadota bacterium]|nr:MAG: aldehyde ferredoxin oxidoreductase [Candidatus Cloacimonadota bacterium]